MAGPNRRRALLGAGLLLLGACLLAPGLVGQAAVPTAPSIDAAEVERIETFLSDLRSLQTPFVQINPNGSSSTGMLYYERPDKMRLDYDRPNPVLIVANGSQVIYHDRKLDQVTHLFTSQTPLAFLLDKKVKLSGDVTITDFQRRAGEIHLTLVQSDEPDAGSISLAFAEQPLALRRWTVVDPQGLVTHVMLEAPEVDAKIDDKLFLLCDPGSVIRKEGCPERR
jgi:outer membrane lipoprotein-sorting protein